MKTDRELLELAAKAAGYTVTAWVEDANGVERFQVYSEKSMWLEWSPLADDGDALRLAVKLTIQIDFHPEADSVLCEPRGNPDSICTCEPLDDFGVRRAIVRAAAAIGEAIQCSS